ncbi:MAG: hypothetical protein J6V92_02215 [Bacteroidaceae bacterium]|nr:hypothetical protein [Bacteroidaceae bacterium]
MSTATLSGLRDYLYSTLTPENMIWLGNQLTEYGHMQQEPQKPYTKEEIYAMIDESERQLANGEYQDFDEAMAEIERELEEEDRKLELAEVV